MNYKVPFLFFPGKGIFLSKSLDKELVYCDVEGARKIFEVVSNLINKKSTLNYDKDIVSKANILFKIWSKLKPNNIKFSKEKEDFNFNFLKIEFGRTHAYVNRKKIDWDKIINLFKEKKYLISKQNASHINKNFKFPSSVYLVKDNNEVIGGGKGLTDKEAMKSAIAESIERLSALNPNKKIIIDTCNNLYKNKEWKFEFESGTRDLYSDSIITEWVSAYNINRKKSCYIPAELTYLRYNPKFSIVKLFDLQHTTGLSCGTSQEEAIVNGIFEILESDAYWITMRTRMVLPDIKIKDVKNLPKEVTKIIKYLEKNNLRIHLKDMSLDWGIPIAHATLESLDKSMPAFVHSSGAGFNWEMAITRAVCEAVQMYNDMTLVTKLEWKKIVNVDGILGEPRFAWCDPLFRPHIEFLIGKSNKKWKKNLKINSVQDLLNIISKKGHEIYSVHLESFYGLEVVRVYISGTTQPDDRLERVGKRLLKYKRKEKLVKGLYSDPILT